jgi:hypothetical protein
MPNQQVVNTKKPLIAAFSLEVSTQKETAAEAAVSLKR